MHRRGFTLVELLIVIIVLGVLAAIVVPKFTNAGTRSRQAARASDLRALKVAIGRFNNDTGTYPASLADLAAKTSPANGLSTAGASVSILSGTWHGPYVDKIVTDPVTGSAYVYSTTAPVGNVTAPAAVSGSISVTPASEIE